MGIPTSITDFQATASSNSPSDTDIIGSSLGGYLRGIQASVRGWYDTGGLVVTGQIVDYAGSSAPSGWLECDGTAVSRTSYANLFTAISTTWGAGDGSTTFNLPDFRGRNRIGKGTGTLASSGVSADVDTSADTLAVASNNTRWVTGMPVVFTLASGTITGLTSGNTYYVIRNSSTTVKLASSLANAQNGTAVDLTAKSSPVWTITYTLTARTLAELGGEESHAMSVTELLAHIHAITPNYFAFSVGGDDVSGGGGFISDGSATQSKGGNAAMNVMSPFAAVMTIIRT